MRKLLFAVAVLALSGVAAKAQTPRVELFTGISYGQFNPGGELTGSVNGLGRHFSTPGFEVTPQFNFSRWLGVVADVSAYGGTGDVDQVPEHIRVVNAYIGPQVTARNIGPFNVFARGLVGVSHNSIGVFNAAVDCQGNSQTNAVMVTCGRTKLSYGFGGGIDLNATKHIALRLVQLDWLRSSFTNCDPTVQTQCVTQSGHQNNPRISAGFEWRF